MKQIKLTQNKVVLVDDEDFEYLNQHKWYAWQPMGRKMFYAMRNIQSNGKFTTQSMHTAIMNSPKRKEVDHINGDALDNRRSNLRTVSNRENQSNRRQHRKDPTSLGASLDKRCNRYYARIRVGGKQLCLGYFDTKEEAHSAYMNYQCEL